MSKLTEHDSGTLEEWIESLEIGIPCSQALLKSLHDFGITKKDHLLDCKETDLNLKGLKKFEEIRVLRLFSVLKKQLQRDFKSQSQAAEEEEGFPPPPSSSIPLTRSVTNPDDYDSCEYSDEDLEGEYYDFPSPPPVERESPPAGDDEAAAIIALPKTLVNHVTGISAGGASGTVSIPISGDGGGVGGQDEASADILGNMHPIVAQKLDNPSLTLSLHQKIECVSSCIEYGARQTKSAKGRHGILLLGNTGAGKSTFANYIQGCKMTREDRLIKVAHDSPIQEIMKIGQGSKSATFIPSVRISSAFSGMKDGRFQDCALVDCPGFLDTRGSEISIANAVNIRGTMDALASVRVVVVLDYHSIEGDRGIGCKRLIEVLSGLFGSPQQLLKHKDSIIVGISKVPQIVEDGLPIDLASDLLKKLFDSVGLDDDSAKFLEHLKEDSRTFFFHPLDRGPEAWPKRHTLVKDIENLKLIVKFKFETSLSPSDLLELQEISRGMKDLVSTALQGEDFQKVASLLNQLKRLASVNIPTVKMVEGVQQDIIDALKNTSKKCTDLALEDKFDDAQLVIDQLLLAVDEFASIVDDDQLLFANIADEITVVIDEAKKVLSTCQLKSQFNASATEKETHLKQADSFQTLANIKQIYEAELREHKFKCIEELQDCANLIQTTLTILEDCAAKRYEELIEEQRKRDEARLKELEKAINELQMILLQKQFVGPTTANELVTRLDDLQHFVDSQGSVPSLAVEIYQNKRHQLTDQVNEIQNPKKLQRLSNANDFESLIQIHGVLNDVVSKFGKHLTAIKLETEPFIFKRWTELINSATEEILLDPSENDFRMGNLDLPCLAQIKKAEGVLKISYPETVEHSNFTLLKFCLGEGKAKEKSTTPSSLKSIFGQEQKLDVGIWESIRSSLIEGHALLDKNSLRIIAWQLVKQFKVATLLNFRNEFQNHFSYWFKSKCDHSLLSQVGDQIYGFMNLENTDLAKGANEVINCIGGFTRFKVMDYNKKAGGVTSISAIDRLKMFSNDSPYVPKSKTLKDCFTGYEETQIASISSIINGSVHGIEPGSSGENRMTAIREQSQVLAQSLDPTRLHRQPRDFGKLLGLVSSLWTLQRHLVDNVGDNKSGGGVDEDAREALKSSLFVPHTTQLLGTMLMAGLGSDDDLQNHLVRCGTGEGKSVCLGLTACCFALLGYDVSVISYSASLSDRDADLFEDLFRYMGVKDKVRYSTINGCVDWLLDVEAFPNVRNSTKSFLKGDHTRSIKIAEEKLEKSLLLVDEVDVLFSKSFYGKAFRPSFTLDESAPLIGKIYDERDQWRKQKNTSTVEWKIARLKSTKECKNLLKVYPNLDKPTPTATKSDSADADSTECMTETILDRHLRVALSTCLDFDENGNYTGSHPKAIVDAKQKRIGYQSHTNHGGEVSYSTSYGASTMFHQYKEFGYDVSFGLSIRCGAIQYSALPPLFSKVLGLTATLPSDCFKRILQPYEFKYASILPSTFDKANEENGRLFTHAPHICRVGGSGGKDGLFDRIADYRQNHPHSAILVFLKDSKTVAECEAFLAGKGCANNMATLDEAKSYGAPSIIAQAAGSGRLTLSTSFYARGTDFPACDQFVRTLKPPGMLVIDTIPWKLDADEVQAKGRTARQNDPGQYMQLWMQDDVEKTFDISTKRSKNSGRWNNSTVMSMVHEGGAHQGSIEGESIEIDEYVMTNLSSAVTSDKERKSDWRKFVAKKRQQSEQKMVDEMIKSVEDGLPAHQRTKELNGLFVSGYADKGAAALLELQRS